jgi:hypothetical protein
VANYEIKNNINISTSWVFGTGNAISLEESQYIGSYGNNGEYGNSYSGSNFSNRNNYRMRSYHRLDVGVNFVKNRDKYERTWSVSAYNTYSRKNPFYVYRDTEYTYDPNTEQESQKSVLKQASLFPVIPYVTYRIDF